MQSSELPECPVDVEFVGGPLDGKHYEGVEINAPILRFFDQAGNAVVYKFDARTRWTNPCKLNFLDVIPAPKYIDPCPCVLIAKVVKFRVTASWARLVLRLRLAWPNYCVNPGHQQRTCVGFSFRVWRMVFSFCWRCQCGRFIE